MPADNAAAVAPAQTIATNDNPPAAAPASQVADGAAQPAAGQSDHPGESVTDRLLDHLGIDGEAREYLDGKAESGKLKAETETETEQPETEPETETEPEKEPAAEEPDEPEGKTEWPKEAIALKDKYRRQRNEARTQAETLEAQVQELQAQLEASAQTAPPPPTLNDPLANVNDLKTLAETQRALTIIRDQCLLKPDGWIADEGKPTERVITGEQVRQALVEAQHGLEAVPQRLNHIQQQPQLDEQARRILPTMFDRGTPDYQAAQTTLREMPWLNSDPQKNVKLAVYLRGWKAVQGELGDGKPASNGNGKTAASLKDAIPPELVEQHRNRGKVPILKQSPPGRPSGSASPQGGAKAVDEAMQAIIDGEDGAAGIGRAFAAARAASAQRSSPRSPVTV